MDQKRVWYEVLRYAFKHVQLGVPADKTAASNFGGRYYKGITPSTPNAEFSIPHGLGVKPYLAMQVLPLDQVGAKLIRLEVTRAADEQRAYFRSPDANAVFYVYVEGGE